MNNVMEELLANSSFAELKQGSIVKGKIIEIRQNEVVVDIGGKSEGVVPVGEFPDINDIQIGQEIEVLLEKLEDREGNPVISYDKAQQKKNWEEILANCKEGAVLSGRVKSKVKGGLIVSIGVDSFLPASQIDVQPPKNLAQYVGQTYDFKVVKINAERKNIVVSRRELIEEQRAEKRRNLLAEVKPGDIRRGVVKNITDYGAFIDLDGLDGLLHITDMSWGRISHPSEMLKVGEEISVMIIEVDTERERVSLGLKQTTSNPWENIERKYPVGAHVRGKVRNLTTYGAFVELEEGIDGMVHVSDMSWTRKINHPSEVLKKGDEVDAIVLLVDPENQRISLGMKQLSVDPWEEIDSIFKVGDLVTGKVSKITNYGAFVELEPGVEGLVHISEMSWTRKLRHPSQMVRQGDEVEVVILGVDPEKKRISLGMKQIKPNPWELVGEKYPEGTILEGVIKNITEFGMFIGIEDGIDGLIHVSDISWTKKIRHPNELFKVGDTVQAKVLTVDQESEKFTLGIKQLTEDPWTNVPTAYPVGGLVKGIITNITDFGLFVEVEEGIEGLVHVSELSNKKVKTPAELYKEGEEIQAKIIHVSAEDRRLGLSIKQLKDEEERKKPREYSRSGPEAGQSLGDLLKQKFEESEN